MGGSLKTLLSAGGDEESRCLCSGAWQGDRRAPPPLQEPLGGLQPTDLRVPDPRAVTELICAPVMKNLYCP